MHLKLIVVALLVSIVLIDRVDGWRRRFRVRVRPRRIVRRAIRRVRIGKRIVKRVTRIGKRVVKGWIKPFKKIGNLGGLLKGSLRFVMKHGKKIYGFIKKNK